MTHHQRGPHSPRLPQPGQRVFQREEGGLGVSGLVYGRWASFDKLKKRGKGRAASGRLPLPAPRSPIIAPCPSPADDVQYGSAQMGSQDRVALVEGLTEDRLGLIESTSHADMLRPLTGEEKGDLGRFRVPLALAHSRAPSDFRKRGQFLPRVSPIGRDHTQGMAEAGAADVGAEADVRPFRGGTVGQHVLIALGQLPQCGAGLGRECQDAQWAIRRLFRWLWHRLCVRVGWGLCQYHMDVGAAHAKRTESRKSFLLGGPWRGRRGNPQCQVVPGDVGIRVIEMEMGGNLPMAQREDHLDETGDPRGGFEVADVGLHRADHQRVVLAVGPAKDRVQRLHLQWIAQLGPGPVRFDIAHLMRLDLGMVQGLPDQRLLRQPVRHGQAAGGAVMVDGRPPYQAPDGVPIRDRIRESLEQDHSASLPAAEAVRGRVECLAPPIRGEGLGAGEEDADFGGEDHLHPAGQGDIRFAGSEALTGQVGGDEGGGARGVDGHAGPL